MADGALGFDPTIPMGFKPTQFGGSSGSDPFETVGKFANIQNALNQNRLFQQSFAARKRMGQIFATSSDPEDAMTKIMQDPLAAPFAGEVISQYRGAMLSLQQLQNEQQTGASSGMDAALKGMSAGLSDPATFSASVEARLRTLSPLARSRVEPAIKDLTASLLDGLPKDPAEARQVFNQRLAGVLLGSGTTPEAIRAITGRPAPSISMEPTGPGGAQEPIQLGGSAAGSEPLISRPADNALGAATLWDETGPGGAEAYPGGTGAHRTWPGGIRPIQGPTQTQSEEFKGIGEAGASIAKDITESAMAAPLQARRIDKLVEAMKQVQLGGLTDLRGAGAKILQGLRNAGVDISKDTIDSVAGGSIKDLQSFVGLLKGLVTRQLSVDVQGQGKAMMPEVQAAFNALNETTDPGAIVEILNQMRAGIQLSYDRGEKLLEFKKGQKDPKSDAYGLDLQDFPLWYNSKINWDKLSDYTRAGFSLAQIKSSDVKGGAGNYSSPQDVLDDQSLTRDQKFAKIKELFGKKEAK